MYAIVDIETTGSHPQDNGITEIAIILHDGEKVEGRFSTLINPLVPIPRYVASLTGITNEMVGPAPLFKEVAGNIYRLLQGRIFVAHNVNFDYSFIRYHLQNAGFDWTARKLCTLRMSRKAFPGLPKYGLGNLCRSLDIMIENRHRATGDAEATTILFDKMLAQGGEKMIREFLKKEAREQILPPNLPKELIKELPYTPGVYYFHNEKGKVIYVGKAKNLKKRVISHFTGLDTGKKRQAFLREIHMLSYKECSSEFTASILESVEIKRLWPEFNISQKHAEQLYGLYVFEDSRGYMRLAIDKKRKNLAPVTSFAMLTDAYRVLRKLIKEFGLHPVLCFIEKNTSWQPDMDADVYNLNVAKALEWLQQQQETFLIRESEFGNTCYVLVENGHFYGMAIVEEETSLQLDDIKKVITPMPGNEMIHAMIRNYAYRYPDRKIALSV
ncbi:exonuclease domain-containing protein [Deminuibacter soli]|uniref:DNA polymerase III subunit epsilon n=1 Tax=Deminuibacter soli TaxID=2291815 RepID=A0A3E1NM79_9BACT|nr:exonuclease domain-containing protein [Deminuibacter soli]RFM29012.1 DNA polymerase III subunit epsilon [Deminuibacter soli]